MLQIQKKKFIYLFCQFCLPSYNIYLYPLTSTLTNRMFKQRHFIDNVIDRLENCLKDMGNALQVYRRKNQPRMDISKSKMKDNKINSVNLKQQDTSSQRINPKPMMKQVQSQLKALTKYVPLDPNQPNPDNMTQEQKDQLRKKLLKDKPKPPINAFICYVKAQKERIKQHSPKNLSIAEVTAIASQQWKNLPAEVKRPYIQEFQQYHISYISKRDQFIKDNPIISKIGFRKQKPRSEKIKAEDIKIQSGQSQIEQSSEISSSGSQNVQRVPGRQIKYRYEQSQNIMQKKIAELMSKPQQRISIESYEQRKEQQDPKSKKTLQIPSYVSPHSKPQLSTIKVPSIQTSAQKGQMASTNTNTKNEAKQKILSMLQARKNEIYQNKSSNPTTTSNLSSNININANTNANTNANINYTYNYNQGRKMESNRIGIGMVRQVIKQETQISSDSVEELSN